MLSDTDVLIEVARCRGCGLLASEITHPKSGCPVMARMDEDSYTQAISSVRKAQSKQILSVLQQQSLTGRTLLDIGCGAGRFLEEARQGGFHISGVEPDDEAYNRAMRTLGEGHVIHGTFLGSHLASQSFDVAATLDVLEHIPIDEINDFAAKTWQVLKTGGIWVIKIPTSDGLYFRIANLARHIPVLRTFATTIIKRLWQSQYTCPHAFYFNFSSLSQFLSKHGFAVVAHRYLQEVPTSTILNRLLLDDSISRFRAWCMVPAFLLVTLLGQMSGKTDSLVVLAKKSSTS